MKNLLGNLKLGHCDVYSWSDGALKYPPESLKFDTKAPISEQPMHSLP